MGSPTVVVLRTTITGGSLKSPWVPENLVEVEGKSCLLISYSDRARPVLWAAVRWLASIVVLRIHRRAQEATQ